MIQNIFRYWIKDLDTKFQIQGQKILMLLDNASPHIIFKDNKSEVRNFLF